MKKLRTKLSYAFYTLLVAFLFCGCSEPNVNEKTTDYILSETGQRIKIIEVDNCEYLYYQGGHQMGLAHKGNCKYCTERSKK